MLHPKGSRSQQLVSFTSSLNCCRQSASCVTPSPRKSSMLMRCKEKEMTSAKIRRYTWLPENSVTIWSLLGYPGYWLIVLYKPTFTHLNTFRERSFVLHCHNSIIQNALVSKRRTLLSWKVVLLMADVEKNSGGTLGLEFKTWWRHVKTIH